MTVILFTTVTARTINETQANAMKHHFIPKDTTVAELEQKAADAEQEAAKESEPRATELREEAKLYRQWIVSLKSEQWTS